ncbi:MAG: hypothetical protein HRT87_00140 [Legionellales bacterium]|nr:hypothetical protein [Legionellales bacterium]
MHKTFIKYFVILTFICMTCIALLIYIMDPYDVLESAPIFKDKAWLHPYENEDNQLIERYFASRVIKHQKYQGAIFGSSTSFLVYPPKIKGVDFKVANLSMRAALPYEQVLMARTFIKKTRNPKLIVLTGEYTWFKPGNPYIFAEEGGPFKNSDVPIWIYSDSIIEKFSHLFNLKTLKYALLQLGHITGINRLHIEGMANAYARSGSSQAENSHHEVPENVIINNIFSSKEIYRKFINDIGAFEAKIEMPSNNFPRVDILLKFINEIPEDITKVFVFLPTHYYSQIMYSKGFNLDIEKCKKFLINRFLKHKNSIVIDMLFKSELTTNHLNFFDGVHFNYDAARIIRDALEQTLSPDSNSPSNELFKVYYSK